MRKHCAAVGERSWIQFPQGFASALLLSAIGFAHGAREAGKLRLEGKDYVVKDGDVMHFRFNV
jgi:hypothetical protein